MAGIYIHIPFCKQRCTYCDFFTEVALESTDSMVDAIARELSVRKSYLSGENISTIYFGGGTPSVLTNAQFIIIFNAIFENYIIENEAEITFEANPDDLSLDFLNNVIKLPFNRISIGIQSFADDDLKRVNRRHTALQAIEAVKNAQNVGFKNISIDLIYGLPGQSLEKWQLQVETALKLNVQHISAYGLTYEEGTQLWKQLKKKKITQVEDEVMIQMYDILLNKLSEAGFEAYEISNFSLPDLQSRHNSAYWKFEKYTGIGPSAHSFDGVSRQWNIANINGYINAVKNNLDFFERELLSDTDNYNDYVMVSLRTFEGIDLNYIEKKFGYKEKDFCIRNIKSFIQSGHVDEIDGKLRLTVKGIQISNMIIMEVMKID